MFKGTPNRKKNKEWPNNCYKAMKELQKDHDVIFVQLNAEHLEYFDKNDIEYYTIYPSLDSWEWIKQRSKNCGNNEKWLKCLEEVLKENKFI